MTENNTMLKLYEHQQKGIEQTKDLNRVAYYWDMGTGKTFVGAEKMKQLNAKVNLVICQKSKVSDWIDHFITNYPEYEIYDLTDKTQLLVFLVSSDTGYKTVGVINYDLAFRRPKLLELAGFTLMLDESSLIQNENAKRSKFALKLGENAANVILLSGTPTGGKYETLWSQLHLLGWNISKKMYWNQYIEVKYLDDIGGRSIPIVTGYKNVDRLKRKMRSHGCQFLKTEEVMNLPEQVFETVKVDSTKEYRKFKKTGIVETEDKTFVGDTTLTKMLYERQLCGSYNPNKAKAFTDLLESTNESFVVFYNFNDELEQIKNASMKCGRVCGVINGTEKSGEKMVNCSLNHNYRYTPILAIQYQAGAMGLNLQGFSRRIIYYSLPLSSELFEQSKKRIHRLGTKETCFYYVLLSKNSIEEKIYTTLSKRKNYTEKLFERSE